MSAFIFFCVFMPLWISFSFTCRVHFLRSFLLIEFFKTGFLEIDISVFWDDVCVYSYYLEVQICYFFVFCHTLDGANEQVWTELSYKIVHIQKFGISHVAYSQAKVCPILGMLVVLIFQEQKTTKCFEVWNISLLPRNRFCILCRICFHILGHVRQSVLVGWIVQ
jgi:hypothetical protein